MEYAQAGFYYLLGTAGIAGIFCLITMTSGKFINQIAKIIVTGMFLAIVLSIALHYILSAAAIVIGWKLFRYAMGKTASAAGSVKETILLSDTVSRLEQKKENRDLHKQYEAYRQKLRAREAKLREKAQAQGMEK